MATKHTYHTIIKDTTRAFALKKAKEQRTRYHIRARAVKNVRGKYDVQISVR